MNRYTSGLLLILLVFSFQVKSQHLKRSAWFGLRADAPSDLILKSNQLDEPIGVEVTVLRKNKLTLSLELREGDLIIQMDSVKILNPLDFTQYLKLKKEGDQLDLVYMRSGQSIRASGQMLGKALEKRTLGNLSYGEVKTPLGYVRTILATPKEGENFPLVYIIQGYGCSSMDRLSSYSPISRLVDGLLDKGYAVLRMEKIGVGDSERPKPCSMVDFYEEASTFEAVYNYIPQMKNINSQQVFVFGHSMGGVIAPMIKQDFPAKGIIVFGTVARPWFEYFIEQGRTQRILINENYEENEEVFPTLLEFYYEFLIQKKTPQKLYTQKKYKRILEAEWGNNGGDIMSGRCYQYWQQLQEIKPFKAWSNVENRVLSLWGDSDFVSFSKADHELIRNMVNKKYPNRADFKVLNNTDHVFMKVNGPKSSIDHWGDWKYYKANFNPVIVETIGEWIDENK